MRTDSDRLGEVTPFHAETANGMVRLNGALVFSTATSAFAELMALLAKQGSVSADLSGLSHSDSAGLAVLIEWRAEAIRQGVHLRYVGAQPNLRALARLADLDAELFQ